MILRQTKFKNHHKTNNECEGEKGRHLSQKDATNSGRNSAGVSPSVRLLWELYKEEDTAQNGRDIGFGGPWEWRFLE